MSVSGMKKQLHKASQLLNERLMGADGTKLDEEFLKMVKTVTAIHTLLAELPSKTTTFLQPNPAYRAKLSMLSTMSRIRGQARSTGYPQSEGILGDCMLLHSQELGAASEFGAALAAVGGALQQVGQARDVLDATVKRTFIDPMLDLHNTELREIKYQLKKVNSRRLDFDYKRRQKGKFPLEEVQQTADKFFTSKELAERSMFILLQNDVDQISRLAALITTLLDFHHNAHRILLGLHGNLHARLTAASNKSTRWFQSKTIRSNVSGGDRFYHQPPVTATVSSGEQLTVLQSRPSSPISSYADSKLVLNQPCCRALYSFLPGHESELSFSQGDIIILTGQVDANWFEGSLGSRSGLLPANYVDVLVPLPLP
ncbi:endophilin-A3b isoform 1-T1 [Xenentodon cancila]